MYRGYLHPGEIVVILTHRGNAGMLFQADVRLLLPDRGRLHQRVADARQRPSAPRHAARPSEQGSERIFDNYARTSGLGAIVVEQAWEEPWMNLSKLGLHGTAVGGVTIYPMSPWLASQAHSVGLAPAGSRTLASHSGHRPHGHQ